MTTPSAHLARRRRHAVDASPPQRSTTTHRCPTGVFSVAPAPGLLRRRSDRAARSALPHRMLHCVV